MFYLSASFQHKFVMDVNSKADRLPHHTWSLLRVTGENLDPGKHRFVVTKDLCGIRPYAFANIKFFRRFPDEIQCVPPAASLHCVFVCGYCWSSSTTKFLKNGLVAFPKFISGIDVVNCLALTAVEGKSYIHH